MVHETFVLAILHQKDLVSHPKPGAWLCQSLHNLIQNEQRAASRENIPLDEIVDVPAEKPPLSLTELLPSELTPEEQDLLIWHFEQQMSYKEMAERLNISEAACRKRISRALASCKRLLDGG